MGGLINTAEILCNLETASQLVGCSFPRGYLGLSEIGHECARRVFLDWRFAGYQNFSGRMYRLFNRGQREEEWLVYWLRCAGYEVMDVDPKTGQQFEFTLHNGHVVGHCDGYIKVGPHWFILEFKTHNERSFLATKRANNLSISKPKHYCQCQAYMAADGRVEGTLYFAVNKNDDAIHVEFVEPDSETVQWLDERIMELVTTKAIPGRVSETPSYWVCQMCHYCGYCFFSKPLNRSCRLCVNVRMVKNGRWGCTKYEKILTLQEQTKGCESFSPYP